ncbi:glycosyl hydrolase family 95 catalytic domain-containing protein [Parasediminibacterium sp. JCM 36343]|uniref:glycosyl hydrolase family 95 catalytic domain-containing protein n=1 Tax=Parasediminibacterium sp. JCM 36343 TaxID=3374279 RepID=UPI0039793770
MKRYVAILYLFAACGAILSCVQPAIAQVQLKVDWPNFLAQQDMVWARMPADYYEGPFVGNGLLGAILFKDSKKENTLCLEIGRTDVYDHRSAAIKSTNAFGRLPIGQLLLSPLGTIKAVSFRTNLWDAEVSGTLTTTQGTITLRCFVPSEEEFIVLDIKATGGETGNCCSFRPEQGNHPRPTVQPNRDKGAYLPNPPYTTSVTNGTEVTTQPLLEGDDYATAWLNRTNADGSHTAFITVANRWAVRLLPANGSAADAVATVQAALQKDMGLVEKAHRNWWHNYYPASFVSLPDARLESFYWIQLYKLASATRGNRPVVDLMGPWFKPSVWAAYWTNLNIQLAYYTLGTTNHLDIADALYQLIEKNTDQLIKNVPPEFRNDCAALGNPVGYGVLNAPVGLSTNNKTPMRLIALPWLMQLFYTHNQLSMDDERLRNTIYPLMKKTFTIYTRIMQLGDDGKYHIPYTYSDEYGNANETSLNIALAKWGYKTLIECANRLKVDQQNVIEWRNILSKMADYPTDSTGIMIGKDVPFAKPHRHYSHLFGIFPLYELNIEQQPESLPLMQQSIEHFTSIDGDNCMFKFNGASSLWAAIGNGDSALKWLNRSLVVLNPRTGPTVTPNTLYSENGWPTFESPIASSRSELDMLLQSWGGKIRVFPSFPAAWKDASFYNLRVEGAFLVSAVKKGGITKFISIKSLKGEPCTIKCDMKGAIKLLASKAVKMVQHDGLVTLALPKGEEAILYSGAKPASFDVTPLTLKAGDSNSWGVNEK